MVKPRKSIKRRMKDNWQDHWKSERLRRQLRRWKKTASIYGLFAMDAWSLFLKKCLDLIALSVITSRSATNATRRTIPTCTNSKSIRYHLVKGLLKTTTTWLPKLSCFVVNAATIYWTLAKESLFADSAPQAWKKVMRSTGVGNATTQLSMSTSVRN